MTPWFAMLLCIELMFGCVMFHLWWSLRSAKKSAASMIEKQESLTKRMATIDRQLAMVGQAVMPISTAFQAILVKELTHFHTPRCDELLEKLGPPFLLTEEEEAELLQLLEERERDMGDLITPSERDAAHIFPAVMRRARVEAQALGTLPMTLRMVSVAATTLRYPDQSQLIQAILSGLPPAPSDEPEAPPHG